MSDNPYKRGYEAGLILGRLQAEDSNYREGKVRGRIEALAAAALAAGFILSAWYLPTLIVYLNRDW